MWYVYAIKSINRNYIYVGLSNDVDRRILEHNKGYNRTTKPYLPFNHFHTETFLDRASARIREKYLKSAAGKKWLRNLIEDKADNNL